MLLSHIINFYSLLFGEVPGKDIYVAKKYIELNMFWVKCKNL